MKLNIYNKREIIKTYTADGYDLMFGTLEDVASAVKLDELETGSDVELIKMVGNLVIHSMDTVKDLLKDIFEGITDEELKHTKINEIVDVFIEVVQYTFRTFGKYASKN